MLKIIIQILIIIFFFTGSKGFAQEYSHMGLYRNFKIMHDFGLSYELTYDHCDDQCDNYYWGGDTVYKAGDNGYGIALQYSLGGGLFMINKRPGLGIGLLGEINMIYSGESSFVSSGVGIEGRVCWVFSFYFFPAYTYFHKKLPVVDGYDSQADRVVFRKKSINGTSIFWGFGLNIPVSAPNDLVLQFIFHIMPGSTNDGHWDRNSLRLGICFVY